LNTFFFLFSFLRPLVFVDIELFKLLVVRRFPFFFFFPLPCRTSGFRCQTTFPFWQNCSDPCCRVFSFPPLSKPFRSPGLCDQLRLHQSLPLGKYTREAQRDERFPLFFSFFLLVIISCSQVSDRNKAGRLVVMLSSKMMKDKVDFFFLLFLSRGSFPSSVRIVAEVASLPSSRF